LKSEDIKVLKDEVVKGIIEGSRKIFGSFMEARISYYEYLVENNKEFPEMDIEYIKNAVETREGFNKRHVTPERIVRLDCVLNKININ
jgi:hypothetical protein